MAVTQAPYEFLVRFKPDGSISGAHIKMFETFTEAGEVILQREGVAHPVAIAGQIGFPLETVLTTMQIAAIATLEAERSIAAASIGEKDARIALLQQTLADLGVSV